MHRPYHGIEAYRVVSATPGASSFGRDKKTGVSGDGGTASHFYTRSARRSRPPVRTPDADRHPATALPVRCGVPRAESLWEIFGFARQAMKYHPGCDAFAFAAVLPDVDCYKLHPGN